MITKELYIKSLNTLLEFEENIDKLSEALGRVNPYEWMNVGWFVDQYYKLLEYCTDDIENNLIGSALSCYIQMKDEEGGCVMSFEGKDYKIRTPEDLWDYLVLANPEIEDKEDKDGK